MGHKCVARRDALVRVGISIMQLQLQPPSWRLKRRKIRRWIHTALLISLRVEVGRETMESVSPISCRLFSTKIVCLSILLLLHLSLLSTSGLSSQIHHSSIRLFYLVNLARVVVQNANRYARVLKYVNDL